MSAAKTVIDSPYEWRQIRREIQASVLQGGWYMVQRWMYQCKINTIFSRTVKDIPSAQQSVSFEIMQQLFIFWSLIRGLPGVQREYVVTRMIPVIKVCYGCQKSLSEH